MRNRFKIKANRKKNNGYQELEIEGKKTDVIGIYDEETCQRVGFIHKEFGKDIEIVFERKFFCCSGGQSLTGRVQELKEEMKQF